jgi:F-type H+-transporting ATPase subunit b
MERDNMLKMHVKLDKMIADSKKKRKAQGLKMIEQAKAAIESEKKCSYVN